MDRTEFEAFVTAALPVLSRHGRALTGNTPDAQDLIQDALLRVWRAWPRIRRDGDPVAYTKTAMARLHAGRMRQLRRRLSGRTVIDPRWSPSDTGRVDNQDLVRNALMTLPAIQRAVLVMTYLDDADDRTIAEALHRRPSSIRASRSRALAALREQIRIDDLPTDSAEGKLHHA
ncbi:sigma-70 family RNA polymerase sigma factor [Polymorphospora rubra]|uniref:DNA-directed RNA polymerase sigma-70 factor n=1 Tax=Polymorphospora rubra TaxID=338584 RepID=A0A810NE73_9ACTN|nr:sigma-70 family RNA polymerase sigma factor [Polymorphospora rubra]BCJ70188.1 DNA-directed RNA polymerase sigma-70 factor [Polymorphospora rubra]